MAAELEATEAERLSDAADEREMAEPADVTQVIVVSRTGWTRIAMWTAADVAAARRLRSRSSHAWRRKGRARERRRVRRRVRSTAAASRDRPRRKAVGGDADDDEAHDLAARSAR